MKAEGMPENEVWTPEPDRLKGRILLSGYESTARYSDITLINEDTGEVRHFDDCTAKPGENTELGETDCVNYTLKLTACELDGWKGFQIFFAHQDEENHFSWTLGGWQNQDTVVAQRIHGRGSDLSQYLMEVERGREYRLELSVRGRRIETSVDGKRVHSTQSRPVVVEPLYYSASVEEATGDMILKVTNMRKESRTAEICLEGADEVSRCEVYRMSGWAPEAENDFEHPGMVAPAEYEVKLEGNAVMLEFPGESFTVVRFFV